MRGKAIFSALKGYSSRKTLVLEDHSFHPFLNTSNVSGPVLGVRASLFQGPHRPLREVSKQVKSETQRVVPDGDTEGDTHFILPVLPSMWRKPL